MKKVLFVVMLVLVLSFGFIALRFGSALTQEGNPIPYLISIARLELLNNGYEKILDTENGNRYLSESKERFPYVIAKEFMKSKGWDFKEQLGAGLVFEKDEKVITIGTRQYSNHYYIWDVPKEVFN